MTQHVNLIKESLRQGRDWAHGGVVLSVLLSAAIVVGAHWVYEQMAWQQAAQTVAEAESAREANTALVQQLGGQIANVQAQLDADEQMRKAAAEMVDPPQNVVPRLEKLIGGLTSTMWLQSVEFKNARGVHLRVNGLKQSDLAQYANALSALPEFSGLPIQVLGIERREWTRDDGGQDGEPKKEPVPYFLFELAAHESWDEPSSEGGQP